MLKRDELADPGSCLNRARDDERVFVLLERDVATPDTIRFWADRRVAIGRNRPDDPQIIDAMVCADEIERRVALLATQSESVAESRATVISTLADALASVGGGIRDAGADDPIR